MPNPDVAWNRADPDDSRWRRFTASLPMRTALLAVAAVWLLGAVWSFTEQSAFAGNKGFSYPHLLPLVIDGFAVAMAGVAWAASLDARPAVAARLATVIAVAASSASNGAWAYLRTNHDLVAVVLGVAVPIAANLAFEVLLAEMRRQVQRRRGLPPPVAIPYPRLLRLGLAPFRTFVEWRALVLDLTAMDLAISRPAEITAASAPAALPEHEPAAPVRAAAPAQHQPTQHQPEPRQPVTRQPVTREAVAYEPDTHESYASHVDDNPSGTPETPHREALRRDGVPEPAAVPASVFARTESPTEQPTRLTQPAPARAATVRPDRPVTGAGRQTSNGPSTRGQTATPAPHNGHSPARRRDLEAVPAAAPARLSAAQQPVRTNTTRRGVDPRVELLAAHLASTEDAGEFTGEMVGPLLNIDVAPRTGRRLLGLARELVNERAQSEADPRDDELSAAIGSG